MVSSLDSASLLCRLTFEIARTMKLQNGKSESTVRQSESIVRNLTFEIARTMKLQNGKTGSTVRNYQKTRSILLTICVPFC